VKTQEFKASIRLPDLESNRHHMLDDELMSGLNPQQTLAVSFDHARGAVLVLAGAGSGKTTVLTRRIAALCRQHAGDFQKISGINGILALTFSKAAALEMAERLRTFLKMEVPSSDFLKIGTFHAFALGLIRGESLGVPNWKRLGFVNCPALIDSEKRQIWLKEVRKEIAPEMAPEMTLALLETWLEHPFTEDSLETQAELRTLIRSRYRDYLFSIGELGFDDMVALAIRILRDAPEVLADFQNRTAYVLVDEFQDTSVEQFELVRILMGESRNLFLVGDDDQAIYGFRGANPGNIQAALNSFPGMQILKLETNYRSTAPIVAYANLVFAGKAISLRKRLVAGRRENNKSKGASRVASPPPVRKIIHGGGVDQAIWMATEIKRLHAELGLAWNEMAILFRVNALEGYYRSLLERMVGSEASQGMVLSTVHAAKGLEYAAVFFVGLEDGILPYRGRGEILGPEQWAEEKRIFYVGVTRAQRYLYLCAVRQRILRGKQVTAEVSPFLRGRFHSALLRLGRREKG
jgi:DNA helicase II / ATP-dependent DNA helicase PcrA